ncbi:hypothetical protein BROUX41_001677 [Berkeleyomyces rouxiae]
MSGDYTAFFYAVLTDHIRHRVVNEDYPGVVPGRGNSVLGVFATGLTEANLEKLDLFEGPEYERRSAKVTVLDKSGKEVKEVETNTYIFIDVGRLEKREWDIEEFKNEKLSQWTRNDLVFADCYVPANVNTGRT